MRKLLRRIFVRLYAPVGWWMISRDRTYAYHGFKFHIPTGVFHPGLFFSSKFLLSQLLLEELKDKTMLEIGSGSGFISVIAASRGAVVTAIDISADAVSTTLKNAKTNQQDVEAVESDLFSNLSERKFQLVVVNPPYFRKQPKTVAEHAWFAGDELQYFHRLFSSMQQHLLPDTKVLMVLNEDCELTSIAALAEHSGLKMMKQCSRTFMLEKNYVFSIVVKQQL